MEQKKGLQQDLKENKEKDKGKEEQDGVKMLELKIRQDGSGTEEAPGSLPLAMKQSSRFLTRYSRRSSPCPAGLWWG